MKSSIDAVFYQGREAVHGLGGSAPTPQDRSIEELEESLRDCETIAGKPIKRK
jgi:hypothetical protein